MVWTVRRVPPHFSIPPENVEVMPGGSVNITCVAIGSPMPFVKWRLGALELTPEDNIPIGKNVLMLDNIRESATYTCVAASDLGNIESDAEVRVKGGSSLPLWNENIQQNLTLKIFIIRLFCFGHFIYLFILFE